MKHIRIFLVRYRAYTSACMVIWMCALVFGIYSACTKGGDLPEISAYTASVAENDMSYGGTLVNSLGIHLKYILALLVSSSFAITLPVSMFLIGFKGYCAGFAALSIIRIYGVKGYVMTFFSLVVPYALTMPVWLMMYVLGLKYQMLRIKTGHRYPAEQKNKEWLSYAAAMLVLFGCLCLFECAVALFVPELMKLLG